MHDWACLLLRIHAENMQHREVYVLYTVLYSCVTSEVREQSQQGGCTVWFAHAAACAHMHVCACASVYIIVWVQRIGLQTSLQYTGSHRDVTLPSQHCYRWQEEAALCT